MPSSRRAPLVVVLVVVACAATATLALRPGVAARAADAGEPLDELADEVGLGEALYARDCVYCHGVDGTGSSRGPSLTDTGEAGAHFWLTTGYMPIQNPDQPVERRPTPYDERELAALIDHVAGLGDGPAVPEVDVAGADLALGGELYRLHCAPCHSATGIGGALVWDEFAPQLFASTPTQTVTAMLVGPGAMPAFPEGAFEPEEIDAIAAYVAYLDDPEDPGGLPLLRAGRVDEGIAAWGLGVLALVVVAAWIGKRAHEEGA